MDVTLGWHSTVETLDLCIIEPIAILSTTVQLPIFNHLHTFRFISSCDIALSLPKQLTDGQFPSLQLPTFLLDSQSQSSPEGCVTIVNLTCRLFPSIDFLCLGYLSFPDSFSLIPIIESLKKLKVLVYMSDREIPDQHQNNAVCKLKSKILGLYALTHKRKQTVIKFNWNYNQDYNNRKQKEMLQKQITTER